jgi:capsular polysaccharide biosynthesis protein
MSDEKEKDLLIELLRDRAILNERMQRNVQEEKEIDLLDFFHVLRRKILVIILAAVVGGALLGVYSFFIATPMYQSTAKVYVLSQSTSITSLADIQLSSELTMDYTEMIFSYPVVSQVKNNLRLDYSYEKVKDMLTVENPADTRVIKVTVISDDPEEAAVMANEFARVSKQTIADIMETDEPRIFERGRVTADPVSPHKTKNIAAGFLGGAFLAALILFALFVIRDAIRTPDDIEQRLGVNVLATVPFEKGNKVKEKNKSRLKGRG